MSEHPRPAQPAELFISLRDSTYPLLGRIATQAVAIEIGTKVPIPSPEETAHTYARVCDRYNIQPADDLDLGKLLARLVPDRQATFRALNGMFPFAHPISPADYAELRGVQLSAIKSTTVRTLEQLRTGIDLRYTKNSNPRLGVSLETLAQAVEQNAHGLPDYDLALLRAMNGLPAYFIPLDAAVIATAENVSRSTIALREKMAAIRLLTDQPAGPAIQRPPRTTPQPSRAVPRPSQPRPSRKKASKTTAAAPRPRKQTIEIMETTELHRLLYLRDAGAYADLLRKLRPGEAQEDYRQELLENLRTAAAMRQRRRTRRERRVVVLSALNQNDRDSPTAAQTNQQEIKEAFNPLLDTPEGHLQLVDQLTARAAAIDPADLPHLDTVIAEGAAAVGKIVDSHMILAHFASHHVTRSTVGRAANALPEATRDISFQGLRQAAERFDPDLGFSFNTYATKTIGGLLLRHWNEETASERGISRGTVDRVRKLKKIEAALAQELQRHPTAAEIADRAGIKNVATVERLFRTWYETSAESLDAPSQHGTDVSLGDRLADQDQAAHDSETDDMLRQRLIESITLAGLTRRQRQVIETILANTGGEPSISSVAAQLGISTAAAKQHFYDAAAKLSSSPEVHRLLHGYLASPKTREPDETAD